MLKYCPFSAPIRESLTQNPQYSDLINRYNTKQQQHANKLANAILKINQKGKRTPQELLDEQEFLKL
jgi:catalase (peroxidase I)